MALTAAAETTLCRWRCHCCPTAACGRRCSRLCAAVPATGGFQARLTAATAGSISRPRMRHQEQKGSPVRCPFVSFVSHNVKFCPLLRAAISSDSEEMPMEGKRICKASRFYFKRQLNVLQRFAGFRSNSRSAPAVYVCSLFHRLNRQQ